MSKISKITILIFSEIIIYIFLFFVLPSVFIRERPGISKTSYNEILPLDQKNSFNQEFISDQNNLRSISVQLKNPQLNNQSKIKIELQNQDHTTLQTLETSGISIGDPSWTNFEFPYLHSQKGDKFFIKISTDNQKMDSLYVYGNRQDNSINLKTTYSYPSFKISLQKNIDYQFNQIKQRSFLEIIKYSGLLVVLNIFIILIL